METIKINDKNYKVSFIDTEDTIRNMVASKEKTFSNYVRFKTFDLDKKNVTVELLHDKLVGVELDNLETDVKNISQEWNIPKRDIVLEWLGIHQTTEVTNFDIELLQILQSIESTDFWGANAINTASKNYLTEKETAVKKLKKIVEEEDEYRKEYSKYTPLKTTRFLQDSVIIEYKITINVDPLEAFDNISLNDTIPFVRLKTGDQNYYKVLKTITPQKDWLDGESTLELKIDRTFDNKEWGSAYINYTGLEEPYDATLTIESTVGSDAETNEDALKNEIIGIFSGVEIKILDRIEKGIKGVFAIPEISISRDVFLDLITNDPMVSHYIYVDEIRELSSQKGVLYLYYSSGTSEKQVLTVFLSERKVSRSDVFYSSKELLLFTPYLNVRVSRATNLNQINRFKEAFATVMDIYSKKFVSIVNEYKELIPNFGKNNKKVIVKKAEEFTKRIKALQSLDSELFIHGYPTRCEKKKQPIPIKQSEQKDWENKGRQVMNYPKGSANFFICSDKNKFKFPGLMENKSLENADDYPYLPCCFSENQKTGNKKYNLYLSEKEKKEGKATKPVSKKVLSRNKVGFLPRNIHYILNKTAKKGDEILRHGVKINNNSFIEVILLAFDPDYMKIDDADKDKYVQDFRNNLAAIKQSAVIQELYDAEAAKITKDILDPDVVFDSKIFIGLLETYYKCQIVVFERTEDSPNGEFEIPRYTQGYLYKKLEPNVRTVLVYKHMGMKSDYLETPHYELIIKQNKKITTWYFEEPTFIQNIYSYFLRTYKLYSIGIGRYKTSSPLDAKSQIVDKYGKVRGFVFKSNIFMATSPLTPDGSLPIVNMPTDRPSWEKVSIFVQANGLTVLQQDVVDNKAIGITLELPNIPYAYIPFKPQAKIGYPEGSNLGFSVPTVDDILQKTLYNRKISDFLMQLIMYSFSLWYDDKIQDDDYKEEIQKLSELTIAEKQVYEKSLLSKLLEQFLNEKLIIKEGYDYNVQNLPRRLSTNNSFFSDDQLIIDSEKTFQRLGYYLRFMLGKNKDLVIGYSKRTYLNNYYTYTGDFHDRKNQLIFVGGLSISNWIETRQQGVSNHIHTIPTPNHREPFFLSHWAINGGNPVIFQNVVNGNLGRALAVANRFLNDGINIGYDATPIADVDHSVYFLENGILKRTGDGILKLWKFADNYYAAILIPQ